MLKLLQLDMWLMYTWLQNASAYESVLINCNNIPRKKTSKRNENVSYIMLTYSMIKGVQNYNGCGRDDEMRN